MAPGKLVPDLEVEFLDIRRDKREQSILQAALESINPQNGNARSLPTLLLYDG